jgi:hypothetical protein
VVLLKHHNRCRWYSPVPLRGEITVSTRELAKERSFLTRQTRLYLGLPEVEAFTCRNPTGSYAHIDNDEPNRSRSEELPDTFFVE